MYQLNKSKNAVIAHFSKEKTPVAIMNNQTENNSVHKIETLFQEEVKSILPVAIMNTQTPFDDDAEVCCVCFKTERNYNIVNGYDAKLMTFHYKDDDTYCPDCLPYGEGDDEEEVKSILPVAIMNTQTEIKHHLPTYQQVIKIMESYLKYPSQMGRNVFEWMSEYSERNHARMMMILDKLFKIKEDFYNEDFDVPEEDKKEIFKIGCDIDKEGGFQAQQACFYIAINFIEPNNNRTKAIEVCWNGAGSWRY